MLCHRYKTHAGSIHWPVYIQPKLNGVRALYHSDTNVMQSHSRQTAEVKYWQGGVLNHITEQLESLFNQPVILDGELYKHGWSLQKINGAVSVNRLSPSIDTDQVQMHVFDIIADVPFADRYAALEQLRTVYPHVVPTHFVSSPDSADHFYTRWRKQGYEGMIYRNAANTYGFVERCGNKENRWGYMIKRKERSSAEFTIIGIKEEHDTFNRPKGRCGALNLLCNNGQTFSAGSGLTAEQRDLYWHTPPNEQIATISYEILSDAGIPLQPVVELVHEK